MWEAKIGGLQRIKVQVAQGKSVRPYPKITEAKRIEALIKW
jgi:hypothetical protein